MHILGIHDGHTATACSLLDGKIRKLASEERFNNVKNQGGLPLKALEWILGSLDDNGPKLDAIAFPGYLTPINDIGAYQKDRHKWYKLASRYLPGKLLASEYLSSLYVKKGRTKREALKEHKEALAQLGLDNLPVHFIEHHTCHAATAYYLDPNYSPERKVLVVTLDGSGDGLSATVSLGEGGRLKRLAVIPTYHSIGILYSRMTAFLGMKPLEHEYKLMGLAPYAPEKLSQKSYEVLKTYFKLDESGLYFVNQSGVWGHELIRRFQKDLLMHRFDAICAGLQRLTEELCIQWLLNWVKETGVNEIALAGGVFMNVKLNMLINERPEIKKAFFMPSCGDESIAVGACLSVEAEQTGDSFKPHPLKHLYFGPEYSDAEIRSELEKCEGIKFHLSDNINEEMAGLLENGKIVGRVNGAMEFGARSLGNRSILANPKSLDIVSKLNRAIKMRDFWMPFAASLLPSGAERYLQSGKEKNAPFMILGYDTTPSGREEIKAGIHQSDFTCRPQIVEQSINPEYYDLLERFEQRTGISGVLNTSFNIHGYPMVNDPATALWTLKNSELDALQLGNYLVERV